MKKYILVIIISIILIIGNTQYVQADMGPKPSLKIIVKNAPKEEYYLDLLVDYPEENGYIWLHEEEYDSEKLEILRNYRDGDWRAAKVTGTKVPLTGELIGVSDGDKMIHDFGYVGVPDRFRIMVLTSNNEIITSEIIETNAFNSVVDYDFKANESTKSSMMFAIVSQFLFTCICTLIIEGVILILFEFKLKYNYKPFLIINIGTQIFLHAVLTIVNIKSGILPSFVVYLFLELVIIILEIKLFRKYLIPQNKKIITSYALIANIVSFMFGIIFIFKN